MTDAELLEEVLTKELPEETEEAFQRMLNDLRRWSALTAPQRAWVEGVARKMGIDVGASPSENLVSSGKVLVTKSERAALAEFHRSLGPLPKKPPGR